MVQQVIQFLAQHLNTLTCRHRGQDPQARTEVMASFLTESDGSPNPAVAGKIVLTVISVEPERVPIHASFGKERAMRQRANHLNIQILISAQYSHERYLDALEELALIRECLERKPVFGRQTDAELPPSVEKITVEPYSPEPEEMHGLWQTLQAPHRPHNLYMVRTTGWESDDIAE